MNKPLEGASFACKPSGPMFYTISKGANMFPSWLFSDRGSVRVRDGKIAIFQRWLAHGRVAVGLEGQTVELSRAEWRALPVYQD